MEIPIIGQANQEGFYPCNFYFHPELENGGGGLVNTPGLTKYAIINAAGGEVRGAWEMGSDLYVVVGSAVYKYSGGVTTTCTGSLLSTTGRVQMIDNGTQLMISDFTYGYYVTGTTVTQITDANFPTPASIVFQDGYGIVVEKDSGRMWISAINDFATYDALDYTTAEAKPDDALAVLSNHRELWIFGEYSTEPYYNSGNADFPFERIAGGFVERGIGAAQTAVTADNTIVWLSDKKQVLKTLGPGQTPVVASTPQLHTEWDAYTTVSDAFAFSMDYGGFTWYVITFPSGNKTWVLNLATNRWHQWAAFALGADVRHPANCYVHYDETHLIGHVHDGCLYKVDAAAYTNGGDTFRSIAKFPAIIQEGGRIFHHKLQVDFKAGVGASTAPQAMLRWSDDRRRTWSNEHWASVGMVGEYEARAIWRRLGRARVRNYEVMITDPVERVIYGAYLNPELGSDK